MKSIVLFLLILTIGISSQAKTLGTVFIEGLNKKASQAVREKLIHDIPKEFDIQDIQQVMEETFSLGSFNGMEIYFEEVEGGKTNITFKFIPISIVRTINFSGNSHFNNLDLLNELGFSENEGLTQEKIQNGVNNIEKYYNLGGYLNAKVSANMSALDGTSDIIVNLVVEENEPCRIDDINVISVNKPLNSKLYKPLIKNRGKIFTQNLLNDMQSLSNDYLISEKYYTAEVQPPEATYNAVKTKVNLKYLISDPYLYSLVFEGNETYNSARLIKEIKLDSDNRLSSSPVEDISERITRFYKGNGYANVAVTHSESLFSQDFLKRFTFTIKEGRRVRIKDIIIEGEFSRPQKIYRNFMYEHSGDQVNAKIFNSDDVELGVKNLVTDLQNQGFLSAKVPSVRTDFDKTREFAVIKINLEEGPQTLISEIIFKGINNLTHQELENVIGLAPNTPLQLGKLEESVFKIVDLYKSKGYLDADVRNKGSSIITYSVDNTRAVLTFDIVEGPLVTVSSIVVEGNTFTKDYVIIRELQFHPGEILTPDKLSYSELKLQRLSIFNSVDIRTLEDDPKEGRRTVLVHVTEHNPGIFKTGVGVNNDLVITLKGFLGTAYRNLFGTGRGVNSHFEFDEKLKSDKLKENFTEYLIDVGYTEPFVFGTKGIGRFNITRSNKLFSIDSTAQQTIANDNSQADFIFERDLSRTIKLIYEVYGVSLTRSYDIYGNDTPAKAPAGSPPGTPLVPLPGALLIATTGPTVFFDGRDNPFNPTKGYFANASVEFSNPYMGSNRTVSYYKAVASYTQYIPIGKVVWANEGRAGYLNNLSSAFDGDVPQIKTFFLGGRSTIRGFDAISESIPYPQTNVQNGIPTEEQFELVKSELRFPLAGNLGGAIFYDGGRVAFPGFVYRFDWRDSVGAGLRYNTPVGPVSLEFGYKLNQDISRNEAPYQIHFSIGVF